MHAATKHEAVQTDNKFRELRLSLKHFASALTPAAGWFVSPRQHLTYIISLGITATALIPGRAWAQTTDVDNARREETFDSRASSVLEDVKLYATAPLRWDGKDWMYFGGALAAVGVAHHFDTDVRTHFTKDSSSALGEKKSTDLQDAIPAAAAFAGTWLYANLADDNVRRNEAWDMLEAAGLSSTTSFILKYAAGRQRPDETSDPTRWRTRGDSFPSTHTTAAFAIGTVLAESGSDDYRWGRRFLGYGLASATGYERLKHNAHWLSDTVAGAALGTATAHFVMNRGRGSNQGTAVMLVPLYRGLMLTYTATLR